jgi:hypothetical protein
MMPCSLCDVDDQKVGGMRMKPTSARAWLARKVLRCTERNTESIEILFTVVLTWTHFIGPVRLDWNEPRLNKE